MKKGSNIIGYTPLGIHIFRMPMEVGNSKPAPIDFTGATITHLEVKGAKRDPVLDYIAIWAKSE